MSKLLERHQMASLRGKEGERAEGQSQLQLEVEQLPLEPSLQEQIEAMRKRYVFNRPGSPDYLSLEQAKSMLLAMGIDSIEAAIKLGIRFNTIVYLRGEINLRDFITKALVAEAPVEEESVPTPTPVV